MKLYDSDNKKSDWKGVDGLYIGTLFTVSSYRSTVEKTEN